MQCAPTTDVAKLYKISVNMKKEIRTIFENEEQNIMSFEGEIYTTSALFP